ncbi:MAG: hypothetical protein H7Z75_20620 [Ferruginibacter sp.]|nr:hypothetical protein [Cytophagales bacterium]
MSILREYEKKVLYLLKSDVLLPQQIEVIVSAGEFIGYEYTGSGYFLSIRHSSLIRERMVCHKPIVIGSADGISCGFIIFIENGELTIECHSWGDVDIPEGFRDRDVQVTAT